MTREVWIYGERVKDVTRHPGFRNSARMLARMYDALHDPQKGPTLSTPTDTGNGGFTHKFYKVPKSPEDLVGSRDAIAEWARISYGWMGRSPDYKASLTGTLGATPNSMRRIRTTPYAGIVTLRSAACFSTTPW